MTPFTSSQCSAQLILITQQIADYSYKMERAENDKDRYEIQTEIDGLMKKYKFFENMYNKAVLEESGTQDTKGYIPRYEYGI